FPGMPRSQLETGKSCGTWSTSGLGTTPAFLIGRLQQLVGRPSQKRKMETMTKAIESVLADALRLDAKARAELAAELLASLDGPADPDAGIAWDREIKRRVDALEAGTEKLESWESVKRRIARDILGQ